MAELADEVIDVTGDQVTRGQLLRISEADARRFLQLVIAPLGALEKDTPNGVVTARVLFDGTQWGCREQRTRKRGQVRTVRWSFWVYARLNLAESATFNDSSYFLFLMFFLCFCMFSSFFFF